MSDFSWSNTEGRYHSTLYNLGPYSASLFLYTECLQVTTRLEHGNQITHHLLPTKVPLESRHSLNPVREVLDDFDSFFPKDPQAEIPIPVPQSWCTPKVKALVDILLSHYSVSFQAIVFVEQRQVAACLARILPVIPELTGKIRSGHFVGEGVNNEGLSSSMGANTGDSLKAFRNGTINTRKLIFYTSSNVLKCYKWLRQLSQRKGSISLYVCRSSMLFCVG
jgi:endoribonuclease Dicer